MEGLEIGFHGEGDSQAFRSQADGKIDAVGFLDPPRLEASDLP